MEWVHKINVALGLDLVPRIRKIVIAVIGSTVIVVGIALLVLPGPAFIVIPIGLLILATEFAWARRVLHRGRAVVGKVRRAKWREFFSPAGDT